MKSLKWRQVNAWRLSQHGLSPRLKRRNFVRAVTRTGGIQAQVMSAAELALWARVDGLTRQDVQFALWQDRTLVKTWVMRGALHLIAADEFPLYAAARGLHKSYNWVNYFNYYGISQSQYELYLAAAPQVLSDKPMTREQFAAALAEQADSPELQRLVLSKGWGTPLKPLAWRGDLCFGPNQGRNVTFVNPKKWLGQWQSVEPYTAAQEIARRYLRAYGPSTPEYFAHWWGGAIGVIAARKIFQSIQDELEPVNVEGWQALALRENLDPMRELELLGSANLLPLFDAYMLGIGRGSDIDPLLPKAYQRQVYRPQGWISAVVLVDGYAKGIWEYTTRGSQTVVKVRLFSAPTASVKNSIEAETARLSAFLNTKVVLEYESP